MLSAFLDEQHSRLAAAFFGNTIHDWSDRLQAVTAVPELTDAVSGLLVVADGPTLDEARVDGALATLVVRWKRQRKKELERDILQGRIAKDDERYQEYLQLVSDLGGQGLKGEGQSASRSVEGEPGGQPPAQSW
jgi:hypothetical protein